VDVTASWDPGTATYADPQTGEHWVYVDPNTYDNPFPQQGPVYTSGPQPVPGVAQTAYASPPVDPSTDPGGPGERPPEPGELGLVGRRAWPTWAMVLLGAACLVLGMAINGNVGTSSASTGQGGYKLPPAAGAGGSTATTVAGGTTATTAASGSTATSAAGGSTATSAASGSTATSAAGGSTATTVAPGPPTVLIPATQLAGNWTSSTFTIAAGQWNIGWAFQCTPAPPTVPTFEIFVVTPGGSPGPTPAVTSSVASGQSVTPQSSLGSQQIVVRTAASCQWAVKVTGFSG